MPIEFQFKADPTLTGAVAYGGGYYAGANRRRQILEERAIKQATIQQQMAYQQQMAKMQQDQTLQKMGYQAQLNAEQQARDAAMREAMMEKEFGLRAKSAEQQQAFQEARDIWVEENRQRSQEDQQAHAIESMNENFNIQQQAAQQSYLMRKAEFEQKTKYEQDMLSQRHKQYLENRRAIESSSVGQDSKIRSLEALDAQYSDVASPWMTELMKEREQEYPTYTAPDGSTHYAPIGKDGKPDMYTAQQDWYKRQGDRRDSNLKLEIASMNAREAARSKRMAEWRTMARATWKDREEARKIAEGDAYVPAPQVERQQYVRDYTRRMEQALDADMLPEEKISEYEVNRHLMIMSDEQQIGKRTGIWDAVEYIDGLNYPDDVKKYIMSQYEAMIRSRGGLQR